MAGHLLVVVPLHDDETAEADVAAALSERLGRVAGERDAVIAVGPVAPALPDLRNSATVARHVLDAAALGGRRRGGVTVLTAADVPDALTLLRVADRLLPMADAIAEPLEILRRHDADHGTSLVDTVAAVLSHPGNLAEAGRALGIHANSLRYRLERIGAVSGIDLHSAPARLRAALALLVWERTGVPRPGESHKTGGAP